MTKGVIKEIMIILLLILAVILLLGVVLYDYVPLNKVIPEKIKYVPTEEMGELNYRVKPLNEYVK